ncbi:extracellular solute-binding protein [Salinarimonas sp. NSM]|uniref:extracellular solute-binding protein n=1 Tax=Salinarimonas sp. NSM TaxID=3458003 RepID=UPI0040355565
MPAVRNRLTRRLLTAAVLALGLCAPLAPQAQTSDGSAADAGAWRHAATLIGEPKYEPGFAHFDYVNPDAPKGGLVRLAAMGTFDNFNYMLAGVRGNLGAGLGLVYETLMTPSMDEPLTDYGLIAEAMRFPEDYSSVTFRLDPDARWHDGVPITVEDVIWSFETLKASNPMMKSYYADVEAAEETAEGEVTFRFAVEGNKELPKIMGQLPVLPEHWWTDPSRSADRTSLEPPLGSGPYRLADYSPGRSITYERVPDAWAVDHPTNVGKYNFDTIRYEYFRDETVMLEAFKGDAYDFRTEVSARDWAQGYGFPARERGAVALETFPMLASGRMQAFVPNLRQERFQDERVRRALNYAFDFEDINRTIFFGAYERIDSFFEGTDLASSGLPEGRELEILEEYRGRIPDAVFTETWTNPTSGDAQARRDNLREADRLLREAGWVVEGGRRVNAETGELLEIELLLDLPSHERYALPYAQALERLGIRLAVRIVDSAQYENRLRAFDFDIVTHLWPQSLSPGNEQRDMWGSRAADLAGSDNVAGIRNPVVDELIERLVRAGTREELVATTKALDRVLLHNDYVIPHWYLGEQRTARWNRFSHPETMPRYAGAAFPTVWWYDAEKARETGAAR